MLTQFAHEHVAALAARTGETTHLVIQEGVQAVFIDHALTDQPLCVSLRSGRCEPLHCTAVGKALIADHDLPALEDLYAGQVLSTPTKRTIRTLAELAEECQRVGKRGFAVDDEEFNPGVRCVAAPIRDGGGQIIAAIGISAPIGRLSKARCQKVGEEIMCAAQEISMKLGCQATSKSGVCG